MRFQCEVLLDNKVFNKMLQNSDRALKSASSALREGVARKIMQHQKKKGYIHNDFHPLPLFGSWHVSEIENIY